MQADQLISSVNLFFASPVNRNSNVFGYIIYLITNSIIFKFFESEIKDMLLILRYNTYFIIMVTLTHLTVTR